MAINNNRYDRNDRQQINGQIRDKEIRVIGTNGEMLGIMSPAEAMRIADEEGLDLVKVSPTAVPPVCRIIDYGKFKYEKTRKEKEAKKKQKTVEIKEIRLSPNIDSNDLSTKITNARKFLTRGDRVKVMIIFRGREMAHKEIGTELMNKIIEKLGPDIIVDGKSQMSGRNLIFLVRHK